MNFIIDFLMFLAYLVVIYTIFNFISYYINVLLFEFIKKKSNRLLVYIIVGACFYLVMNDYLYY